MKNYSFAFKLFFSNTVNIVIVIVAFLLSNMLSVFCIITPGTTTLVMLISSLLVAPVYYALFLFLAYEFYGQIEKVNMSEILTEKATFKLRSSFFFVLMTIDALFFFQLFIYDFAFYLKEGINHPVYLLRLFLTLLLYNVLPVVLAILTAMLISAQKRIIGYPFLLIVALVPTMVFERLARVLNVYDEYEFFKIFPYLKYTPNHSFGVPLLPYCWAKVCFFIFLVIGIILLREVKGKAKLPVVLVSFTLALVCVFIYIQPVSKVDMHESYQLSEMKYYYKLNKEEQAPNFKIEKYDMKFTVRNQLSGDVKVYLDGKAASSYDFTLYHGYKVKDVLDENGDSVKFEQNGDFITVTPKDSSCNMFEFIYTGSNMTFYSNFQGIYLSGGFAYYPKAGHVKIYDYVNQNYIAVFDDENTSYAVTVNQLFGEVYSNIKRIGKNQFDGQGNGVILYSGMLAGFKNGNIEVVFPYMATDMIDEHYLNTETEKFKAIIGNSEKFYVFSIPNMNNQGYDSRFSNAFELVGIIGLEMRYLGPEEFLEIEEG